MAQIGETHFLAHLIAQARFYKDWSLSAVRPHLVCKHSSIHISQAFFIKVAERSQSSLMIGHHFKSYKNKNTPYARVLVQ